MSPAYDMNPTPMDVRPRVLSTEIDFGDAVCSIDTLLKTAEFYDLTVKDAKAIIGKQAEVISTWRQVAREYGVPKSELERMASAFEHDDLDHALRLT